MELCSRIQLHCFPTKAYIKRSHTLANQSQAATDSWMYSKNLLPRLRNHHKLDNTTKIFMQIITEGDLLSYWFPPHSNRTHLSSCCPGIALRVLSTPNYVNMCMQDRFITTVLFALNRLFSVALSYKKNNYYITNNQLVFVISSTQIRIRSG